MHALLSATRRLGLPQGLHAWRLRGGAAPLRLVRGGPSHAGGGCPGAAIGARGGPLAGAGRAAGR
eukprot:10773199-Lingulodinium_polyedra.AAC.1